MKNPDSPPPAQGRTNSTPRILFVDDEIYIRELMVQALGELGYEAVDTAANCWTRSATCWTRTREVNVTNRRRFRSFSEFSGNRSKV
jgi:AmiR/NasT family two-component response regulator